MTHRTPQYTRNPQGWGYAELAVSQEETHRLIKLMRGFLGTAIAEYKPPATQVDLPAAKVELPKSLRPFASVQDSDRLLCARGRSYPDLVELRHGTLHYAPDAVVYPSSESELDETLEWADRDRLAVIPFGGGSSVVGGVNPAVPPGYNGVITVDLQRINHVADVCPISRVVHAGAGILGPALETALRPYSLSARHYPQSYHHSTLGGWVATRGGGHFSTLWPKIEDRVCALKVKLADGRTVETRQLPASSIATDPNRLWAGSEGALGIITEVGLRVGPIPTYKKVTGVRFPDFSAGLQAVRTIVQAGLWPSHLRLLDPFESLVSDAISGGKVRPGALLIVGFESAFMPVETQLDAALTCCKQEGGHPETASGESADDDGVERFRSAFFRQPYLRDAFIDHAIIADTFETAVPWHLAESFYETIRTTTLSTLQRVCGNGGVLCRTTHAYPDGVALYFSFYAAGERIRLCDQWWEIKRAVTDAVVQGSGTASHHHAMGRYHLPQVSAELPAAFRSAMASAKRSLDPNGLLNPGCWFEPDPA